MIRRLGLAAVMLAALTLTLVAPGMAVAHGDDESGEAAALAEQPARVLAQQAIALLQVQGDVEGAAMRLDAAVESKDKRDIDAAVLRSAMETLDGGDRERAVVMLDRALSRPLGSESGKVLHEAGREFRPGTGAEEIVGIVAGAVALAMGALGLLVVRPRRGWSASS